LVDRDGNTILHRASSREDLGVMEGILRVDRGLLNTINKHNHTALFIAIFENK